MAELVESKKKRDRVDEIQKYKRFIETRLEPEREFFRKRLWLLMAETNRCKSVRNQIAGLDGLGDFKGEFKGLANVGCSILVKYKAKKIKENHVCIVVLDGELLLSLPKDQAIEYLTKEEKILEKWVKTYEKSENRVESYISLLTSIMAEISAQDGESSTQV